MRKLGLLVYIPLFVIGSIICLPLIFLALLCESADDAINGNYHKRYL